MKNLKEIFQKYIVGIMIAMSVTFGGAIIEGVRRMYNVPSDIEQLKKTIHSQDSILKQHEKDVLYFYDKIK